MVLFPLPPRVSRIIVESILKYPDVLHEVLIAAAFLSTHSPFVLPQGEEVDARKAHHSFRDIQGDFVSYVKLFKTYKSQKNKEQFCKKNYLDEKVMAEIENIVLQLSDIISEQQIPISTAGKGSMDNYLCCIACGMIQFVCVREGRENFRSLTADHISIHPGSNMFRTDPMYIVAGEIVRTSRMFAMSVSPLTKSQLAKIDENLERELSQLKKKGKQKSVISGFEYDSKDTFQDTYKKKNEKGIKKEFIRTVFNIGNFNFDIKKVKGKQIVILPLSELLVCVKENDVLKDSELRLKMTSLKGKVVLKNGFELLSGEKLELIFKIASVLNLIPVDEKKFNRKLNINISEEGGIKKLCDAMQMLLNIAVAKSKSKEMGFICAFTDNNGNYWFKVSRGFSTALSESLSTIETLIDQAESVFTAEEKEKINAIYRNLNNLYE